MKPQGCHVSRCPFSVHVRHCFSDIQYLRECFVFVGQSNSSVFAWFGFCFGCSACGIGICIGSGYLFWAKCFARVLCKLWQWLDLFIVMPIMAFRSLSRICWQHSNEDPTWERVRCLCLPIALSMCDTSPLVFVGVVVQVHASRFIDIVPDYWPCSSSPPPSIAATDHKRVLQSRRPSSTPGEVIAVGAWFGCLTVGWTCWCDVEEELLVVHQSLLVG